LRRFLNPSCGSAAPTLLGQMVRARIVGLSLMVSSAADARSRSR
jgi:hypothetical protein